MQRSYTNTKYSKPRTNCLWTRLNEYRTCDAIEGLEEGLNALRYDDHNFKDYEVIYLVMPAEETLFASMIITTVEDGWAFEADRVKCAFANIKEWT
jgi:hypothetical protein